MKKVSIVILNWNGAAMLHRFLPTVVAHSADIAEIVVADNSSSDNSIETLKSEFPEVRIIVLDRNYGFAGGYNHALKQVSTPYYMLLNSDVEVGENWLGPLVDFMDAHPEAAACQPKLLAEHTRDHFEYAGASGGYIDRYGYPYCRGRVFETVEKDEGQYDDIVEVLWATGACLMIRRDDFWRIGGFDERFFAHNEEIDLCWRLYNLGRRIFCVPQCHVYHVGGGTLQKGNPMKTFLNFRNNLTMLYKNLPEKDLHHVMRVRFWLDYVAAFKSLLLDRNWGEFRAVLRGRKAYKAWRADFADDRRRIQASRIDRTDPEVADLLPRASYSILWQYYVKGNRMYKYLRKAK